MGSVYGNILMICMRVPVHSLTYRRRSSRQLEDSSEITGKLKILLKVSQPLSEKNDSIISEDKLNSDWNYLDVKVKIISHRDSSYEYFGYRPFHNNLVTLLVN
jgi:hypothetical protein